VRKGAADYTVPWCQPRWAITRGLGGDRWPGRTPSPVSVIHERDEAALADDDVIEDTDTDKLADVAQAPRGVEVLASRTR
jgi:hypothetical protein